MEVKVDTRVFLMSDVFLEFGYTTGKLQSLFGRRDQEQRSQIAKRRKDKREREKKKIIVGVSVGLWILALTKV